MNLFGIIDALKDGLMWIGLGALLLIAAACALVGLRRVCQWLCVRLSLSSYTNAVLNLNFPIDAALDDDNASRLIGINLSAYCELVECGFSMLCDLDSMTPGTWDFLLKSSHKCKKALEIRAARLEAKGVPAARFRRDALFNDLRDCVQNCFCIIERGWYPSAKRRMSPSQLIDVRKMIKDIFGTLPPDIAKDETTNLSGPAAIPPEEKYTIPPPNSPYSKMTPTQGGDGK